ncbi:MAG: nucleotide pyrophosphohydrolase [Geobacteraceae bacterium]|nr:nucleotide pyrophosphohydrolase [Geobacteraceae bacterium]
MDKTILELTDKVREFCEARDWDQHHGPKDLAIGVITEASELLEHFRFLSEEQALELFEDKKSKEDIEDELADVLFFLLREGNIRMDAVHQNLVTADRESI